MSISSALLRVLRSIPEDRPSALLLRHAERPPLSWDESDYTLPITDEGARASRALGALLGVRLRGLHTSPLTRCMQTARAIGEGAGVAQALVSDRLLGDPGAFVVDAVKAQQTWIELGHARAMAYLTGADPEPLPGLAAPATAAQRLVDHLLSPARLPGVHVFVTHDSVIAATVAQLAGRALVSEGWPQFLEGALFWRGASGVEVACGSEG